MAGSMNASTSSVGGSNTNSGGLSLNGEVKCQCGKLAVVKKSMTDDNPWRRFYGCGNAKWSSCNFFKWFDVERPHGWQKRSLVEARDIIRDQAEELKKLRGLSGPENANVSKGVGTRDQSIDLPELELENRKLKEKIALSIEKEKLLRQFVVISWIGFVVVIAVIVNALN